MNMTNEQRTQHELALERVRAELWGQLYMNSKMGYGEIDADRKIREFDRRFTPWLLESPLPHNPGN